MHKSVNYDGGRLQGTEQLRSIVPYATACLQSSEAHSHSTVAVGRYITTAWTSITIAAFLNGLGDYGPNTNGSSSDLRD